MFLGSLCSIRLIQVQTQGSHPGLQPGGSLATGSSGNGGAAQSADTYDRSTGTLPQMSWDVPDPEILVIYPYQVVQDLAPSTGL